MAVCRPPLRRLGQVAFAPPGQEAYSWSDQVSQFVDREGQSLEDFCRAAQAGRLWARGQTHGSQAIFVDKWFLDVEIIGKFISMISGSTLARGPPLSISSTSASGPSVLHLLEVIGKWLLYGAIREKMIKWICNYKWVWGFFVFLFNKTFTYRASGSPSGGCEGLGARVIRLCTAWLRSPPLPRDYIACGVYSKCAGVLGMYNYFKGK